MFGVLGFRAFALAAVVAGTFAGQSGEAKAEVALLNDDMFVVRHTGIVGSDAMTAWEALLKPAEWWSGAHSFSGDSANFVLDARAGGCFCEMLPVGEDRSEPGSVKHMEVLFVDPGKAMRLTGALGPLQSEPVRGVLTVTFKPMEKGTQILFEYAVGGPSRYDQATIAPAVDRVIGEQLTRLVNLLGEAGSDIDARAIPGFEPDPSVPAVEAAGSQDAGEQTPPAAATTFGAETRAVPTIEEAAPAAPAEDGAPSGEADADEAATEEGIGADFLSR